MKTKCLAIPMALTFGLVTFLQTAEAVSPAPDGGYPGGNTAEGQSALLSLTTGSFNTAVGFFSLRSDTIGRLNTAVGAGTLLANTADGNTATGAGALFGNTTGTGNTANGAFALVSDTTGGLNTAVGQGALQDNTTGNSNTACGGGTLINNATGGANVAIGSQALGSNTAGHQNTAVGSAALFNSTTGTGNIAVGINAGIGVLTASSVICIGTTGANVSDSCYIGNIFGVTSSGGTAVFINSDGKLGTSTSSRRFKKEIKPMDSDSGAVFALKPVTFRYKKEIDPAGMQQFGLVAEEVEKVNPDLVVRDKEGKPYSVRYEQVNAMLLNEFLKEHRKNEEQEATIARQQKQIEVLTEGLQKVSAQIEANERASHAIAEK
jgi:hypothetical protein